ncbi:putative carbohydrate transporter [Hibiscus syriacus]|uniref:Carbohydrate transporter n=1 Tax=Hibiscus syriacus TaxID=106335 RepID=A0A6A2YJY6_HIBSY|nr:uncharacterized protein LOC120160892 [Hibiscus syriacus]KAE8679789.1 putative carbohydrate transporter [Hibiscus syriacus]
MDSGNSSSMQSSSGGDEEYDSVSRPESVTTFLNTSGHFNPLSNQHPDQAPTLFDPCANYLNPFSLSLPNNSSLLNFDGVGPRTRLGSEPNATDLGNLQGSSLSSQFILGSEGRSFPSPSSRSAHDNGVKNPKKRTRASRRAPTTVLTTDTRNFRAMVQEFTGIPAPPFSGSSYSKRLDLFGSGSRPTHLEPLGSLFPLRPSAKRLQTGPSSSPSLLNNPLLDAANTSNTTMANAFNLCDLGLLKQPQNMQSQSQILSFQSFLDPPPLHPSLSSPGFGLKPQGSSAMPSTDELGLSHGHLTPEATRSRIESNWSDHAVGLNDGNYGSNEHNSQRVNSCKLNYLASSSTFHHDKGLENVSSRGEDTVDSWICPAD